MAIDIGADAIPRPNNLSFGLTTIDVNNPANASGTIDSVEIYAENALEGCKVGIFYATNGNTFKCRSVVSIGNVASGSKQTIPIDPAISVTIGDYIGAYYTAGALERTLTEHLGIWYYIGDKCTVDAEDTYTEIAGDAISLYGTGEEGEPPVTEAYGYVV